MKGNAKSSSVFFWDRVMLTRLTPSLEVVGGNQELEIRVEIEVVPMSVW